MTVSRLDILNYSGFQEIGTYGRHLIPNGRTAGGQMVPFQHRMRSGHSIFDCPYAIPAGWYQYGKTTVISAATIACMQSTSWKEGCRCTTLIYMMWEARATEGRQISNIGSPQGFPCISHIRDFLARLTNTQSSYKGRPDLQCQLKGPRQAVDPCRHSETSEDFPG